MEDTCESCRYFEMFLTSKVEGNCHAAPPAVIVDQFGNLTSCRPTVYSDDTACVMCEGVKE